MRERFSSAGILWRWIGTPTCMAMGVLALRDRRVERDAALVFFLMGAVMIGWEGFARLTRKTLVLHPGKVEVFRRDTLLGSFDPAQARYYGWISKVKPLVVGVLLSGLLVLVGFSSSGWSAAALMLAALVSVAAMIHDFLTRWTIESPKSGGSDPSLQIDDVKRTVGLVPGVDVGRWTLTPAKDDVIGILGFWPGDRMDSRMLRFSLLLGSLFAPFALVIVAVGIYMEMYALFWLAAIVGIISAWTLTAWARFRQR
jgi:hypothetical protein